MKRLEISEEALRKCADARLSHEEAAIQLGVSRGTVCSRCEKWGIKFNAKRGRVSVGPQESPEWLKARAEEGLSCAETADLAGVGIGRIYRLGNQLGIKFVTKLPPPHRKYAFDEHFLDVIDTEAKAYMLGLFSADGCVLTRHGKVKGETRIKLHERDKDVLESLHSVVGHTGPLRKDGRNVVLALSSVTYVNALASYGITPRKSLIMPWPEIPEEYRLAYIRGIMEGDGSIGRQCRFVCGSFQFVSGFADWYRGRYGKDFYMKVENTGVNPKWRVVFNRRDAQFVHDIYAGATVYMRRKYDRYLKFWKDHCNASA